MRVLIIGAYGKIGKILVEKLDKSIDFIPIAMVRKAEQFQEFLNQGIEAVLGDLEGSINSLTEIMSDKKVEAVVFTAGSGEHTGADKTMLIDLDGAVKSIKAAKKAQVQRYIIVSAVGVNQWHNEQIPITVKRGSYYSAAKYYADLFLENSMLNYTILRPSKLTDESGKNKISVNEQSSYKNISREDVAQTIIEVLISEKTINKSFDISGGTRPIEEAILL